MHSLEKRSILLILLHRLTLAPFQCFIQFHIDSICCGVSAIALGTNAPTILREEALEYAIFDPRRGSPIDPKCRPVCPFIPSCPFSLCISYISFIHLFIPNHRHHHHHHHRCMFFLFHIMMIITDHLPLNFLSSYL